MAKKVQSDNTFSNTQGKKYEASRRQCSLAFCLTRRKRWGETVNGDARVAWLSYNLLPAKYKFLFWVDSFTLYSASLPASYSAFRCKKKLAG